MAEHAFGKVREREKREKERAAKKKKLRQADFWESVGDSIAVSKLHLLASLFPLVFPFPPSAAKMPTTTPRRPAAPAVALLLLPLLFVLVVLVPSADAAAKCITYFVKTPGSPFSYKAGFAAWPTTCNPKFYK